MGDVAHAAATDTARRQIKRAAGLLRDATRNLAVADSLDTVATYHVHDTRSARDALQLIEANAAKYGAVDVLIIARPTRRAPTTTAPVNGAKETHAWPPSP